MARGDHLKVRRRGYWHHGIDCGDGTVIHYAGMEREKSDAYVRRTSLAEFCKGRTVRVAGRGSQDPELAMSRAESALGTGGYHLLFNNCEHFSTWSTTGRRRSSQLTALLTLGSTPVIRWGLESALRVLEHLRR
ncbi:MAG TPA: lecithin retinol acyltransferase family protein [Candidatus Hydrogenedentes bacterium]|jgi:hypothetical protein|nr:lecithin retinol acyltransferase family protein [FCB group bacterium]HNV21107.1 lecithin retinol acyltransferase family protein [Candidatus Hydrogenedentota bacterium]HPA05406.1 lecithin retinol acyltransferase family protein [Candidatus Hydrogenedentota bacterium]HPV35819.1 lecithin retinol acyltransferase family protein [Candidatus Hydrogenedentota bacterium]HPX39736.1 lecithin retinol acyltransferase family protein [Candidatus Hydrogenedentota bacterium]